MPSLLATIARIACRPRAPEDPQTNAAPVALYHFDSRRHPNFGDRLNVDLVERLTGRRVRPATAHTATHVCIGSLLQVFLAPPGAPAAAGPPLAVWGTGFIAGPDHDRPERFVRPLVVHAVRGRLSLARLGAAGIDVSRAALGDPGLLARLLVPAEPVRPACRLGLVAHYVYERDPVFARVRSRVPTARIIRVAERPARFLAQLRECEVVLSSAMHGLIAADALGIPNARIRVSDRITGGDYKFRDYYSVFGVEPRTISRDELWRLSAADLVGVEDAYAIDPAAVTRVADGLLAACPVPPAATAPRAAA